MVRAENSGPHYTSEASFRMTVSTMLPNGSLFGDTPGPQGFNVSAPVFS